MERNLVKNRKEKGKKVKKPDNVLEVKKPDVLEDSFETSSETGVKKMDKCLEMVDLKPENSDRVLPIGYADVYSSWSMD